MVEISKDDEAVYRSMFQAVMMVKDAICTSLLDHFYLLPDDIRAEGCKASEYVAGMH